MARKPSAKSGEDKPALLAGASKMAEVRYLDLREGDPIDDQLADWITQASKLPGERL